MRRKEEHFEIVERDEEKCLIGSVVTAISFPVLLFALGNVAVKDAALDLALGVTYSICFLIGVILSRNKKKVYWRRQ